MAWQTFGAIMNCKKTILDSLYAAADAVYRDFNSKIISTVDKDKIIGELKCHYEFIIPYFEKNDMLNFGISFLIMGRDPVELAKRAKYKPPAMRVRGVCYTKKSPFRYNEVVQAKQIAKGR